MFKTSSLQDFSIFIPLLELAVCLGHANAFRYMNSYAMSCQEGLQSSPRNNDSMIKLVQLGLAGLLRVDA